MPARAVLGCCFPVALCRAVMNTPFMRIVTRFAPSPTGDLHIGGARTALFNRLFAHRFGGKFLLRIEDTDKARSTPEAIDAILDGMSWLGLVPDAPPIFQSLRADRHREAALLMVEAGSAFRCYVTQAELQARREAGEAARAALAQARQDSAPAALIQRLQTEAEALTRAFRSPYRDGAPAPSVDAPHVIRLRAPEAGDIAHDDLVQGLVRIAAQELDDLILLRADGTPTYMLAVVVDDHDMGITHIIRGDDHLTNAARQIPIYRALDWPIPAFAHVPLIHGPDGAKLSKRHGALAVQGYRELGYLPEALSAYLVRLGWSAGDREIMRLEEAEQLFDLKGVVRSPARLDFDKLANVNAHYLREADEARLLDLVLEIARKRPGFPTHPEALGRISAALPLIKTRAKTILELADAAFVFAQTRPIWLDESAEKLLNQPMRERMQKLLSVLQEQEDWGAPALGAALKTFAASEGVGFGQIGPGLRALITGSLNSPDLAEVLALLGKDEAIGRLRDRL
jgi:glutamyl-tRNA synthetase